MAAPAPLFHIVEHREPFALPIYAAAWDRMAAREPCYRPLFSDLWAAVDGEAAPFRFFAALAGEEPIALACFLLHEGPRAYWLGRRKLGAIRLRMSLLFGGAILGDPDEPNARAMLQAMLHTDAADLLLLDDIVLDGPTHRAARSLGGRHPVRVSTHNAARRLIDLPATLTDYLGALRPSTRKALLRDVKLFDRLSPTYAVYRDEHAISDFLPKAAALSSGTYQQGLGLGLDDNEHMRAHFRRLAQEGRLRCYLASVDGQPRAFAWGDLAAGTFYFRATGYDAAHARDNAGKAILLRMIADLIDWPDCRRFDFGIRDMGYKARFATATLPCAHVALGRWGKPRAVAAILLDRALDTAKALVLRLRKRRLSSPPPRP